MQSLTHKTCAATAPLHGLRPATITSPHVRPVSASRSPCSRLLQRLVPRSRREQDRLIARVAEAQSPPEAADVSVSINNKEDADYSVLYLSGANRPGLLTALSAALRDLSLEVKRIHEYKRQLLNVLGIIYRYDQIKKMTAEQRSKVVPRVCIIGGKAAPGYEMAKRIIKLICAVGEKINSDKDVGDLLKFVFYPDYNVSGAEILIPASELSQHISTAGTEASGTSNMKFQMNGCLIIGTMDGANIEIAEEGGKENMFIFGAEAHQVSRLRAERKTLQVDPRFTHVVELVRSGFFGWEDYFGPIMDAITTGGDYYLVANDFAGYLDAQARVDETYQNPAKWDKMSIMMTAGSGKFSTDRTISEYAKDIWKVEPCVVPQPGS